MKMKVSFATTSPATKLVIRTSGCKKNAIHSELVSFGFWLIRIYCCHSIVKFELVTLIKDDLAVSILIKKKSVLQTL